MQVNVTADEMAVAFQSDWPLHAEVTALRLATAAQARRIAELEAAAGPPDPPPATE